MNERDCKYVENVVYKCTSEPIAIHPLPSSKQVEAPATHSQLTNSSHPQQNKICYDSCHSARGGPVDCLTLKRKIMISFEDAVATLRKNGCKEYKDVTVRNVTVKPLDSYTRVALTLDTDVEGFVAAENGSYERGTTRVVFNSLYSLVALLKQNDDTMAIASHVVTNPTSLQVLLSGAKITILQQEVAANATYTNAWTGKEVQNENDHDSIFNHVVSVSLTDKAKGAVSKIEDKLLGL